MPAVIITNHEANDTAEERLIYKPRHSDLKDNLIKWQGNKVV